MPWPEDELQPAGDGGASLHFGSPWADDPEQRDQVRRARGRMPLPVTVWLAATTEPDVLVPPLYQARAGTVGLTVSSLVVAPGQPGRLAGVVSPSTDFGDLLVTTPGTRFTVHLLAAGQRRLARHFAGDIPSPPGDLDVLATAFGPALAAVADRVFCELVSCRPYGWSHLAEADVVGVELGPRRDPLGWYGGMFVALDR